SGAQVDDRHPVAALVAVAAAEGGHVGRGLERLADRALERAGAVAVDDHQLPRPLAVGAVEEELDLPHRVLRPQAAHVAARLRPGDRPGGYRLGLLHGGLAAGREALLRSGRRRLAG